MLVGHNTELDRLGHPVGHLKTIYQKTADPMASSCRMLEMLHSIQD